MRRVLFLLAAGLAFAGEEEGFARQVALLGDRKPEVRLAAARAVASFATHRSTVEPHTRALARALRDPDPEVRRLVGEALRKAGPEGIPALIRALAYPQADARTHAARALAAVGKPALSALEETLGKATRYRAGAAETLGYLGAEAAPLAPALIELLSDEKPLVRSAAALALGRVGALPERAAAILVRGFDDREFEVAENCVVSLGRLGPAAVPFVLAALDGDRERAIAALAGLATTARPALEEILRSGSGAHRVAVAHAMASKAPESTRRLLVAASADESASLRVAATQALGSAPAEPAITAALLARCSDAAAEVRAWAAFGLAQRAEPPRKLFDDSSPEVRAAATFASAATSGWARPVVAPLRRLLVEHGSEFAARGLARIGRRAAPAVADLIAAAEAGSVPATEALGALLEDRVRGGFAGRGTRLAEAPQSVRRSVERALAWLASSQEEEGRWSAARHGGYRDFDVGVTGLALLAFLGAGHDPFDGAHAAVVRRGLRYLLRLQKERKSFRDGPRSNGVLQHAIATQAVAEAWAISGSQEFMAGALRGCAYLESARNVDLAWKYEPRSTVNDTHDTAWAVQTLVTAELAGRAPSRAAYEGALRWLEKMRDRDSGRFGYDLEGGGPASLSRTERGEPRTGFARKPRAAPAATAMGLWTRHLLGQHDELDLEGARLLSKSPPAGGEAIDLVYWRFGALAVTRKNLRVDAKRWLQALHRTLLGHQEKSGRWPPEGYWGPVGGSVYSTAMGALALLAPYTHPRGFRDLSKPFRQARTALERVRSSANHPARRIAERALRAASSLD